MSSKGTSYIVKLMQEGTSNEVLTNSPDGYILYEESFKPTPLGKSMSHRPGSVSTDLFNEVQVGGWSVIGANYNLAEDESVKIYINALKNNGF